MSSESSELAKFSSMASEFTVVKLVIGLWLESPRKGLVRISALDKITQKLKALTTSLHCAKCVVYEEVSK